jgi:hypothetical protein
MGFEHRAATAAAEEASSGLIVAAAGALAGSVATPRGAPAA